MISKRVKKMMEDGLTYPLAFSSEVEKDKLTKLCSNENPVGPSPKAVETVKKAAGEISEYPDSGCIELKEAIGDFLDVNPSCICVGNGSDEIMDLVCKAATDPDDKVIIPTPTFSEYELASRINALRTKFIKLKDFRWDPEELSVELRDARATFIGRPNNPTGNSIDEKGLKKLLETGKLVVVDEAYGEFSDESVVSWVENYENLLVLRTFSKIFGLAGLRVGYGVASVKLTRAIERVRPPFSVNLLAQKAAIAALEDRDFLERIKNMISQGRDFLSRKIGELGMEVLPSKANFIMASPKPLEMDSSEICDCLSRKGVLIRNLIGFRGTGRNWVRVTVGTNEQNKKLIEKIKECIEEKS